MDRFAMLPREERRIYFEQAAAQLGLSSQVLEKDFWVCWTLKKLFSLDGFRNHLTFKGGTSLSKVYQVIERFSEDVDISLEREFLGFGGEMEPENAPSVEQQKRRIAELREACIATIADKLQPQLSAAMASALSSDWSLQLDPDDGERRTLLFQFPPAITSGLSPYVAQTVKVEIESRSDHFPVENATVYPYVYQAFQAAIQTPRIDVRVLGAERTFWEKATILHMLWHQSPERRYPPRMSRHYYDMHMLSRDETCDRALANLALLDRVATHKSVFFRAAWANYRAARPGGLKLVPSEKRIAELKQDYIAMQAMFFGEVPEFGVIISDLRDLERRINGSN